MRRESRVKLLFDALCSPENDTHQNRPPRQVDKKHYYAHPEMYRSTFAERIAPYASVIVNCLYWDQRFPRLLTSVQAEQVCLQYITRIGGSERFVKNLSIVGAPTTLSIDRVVGSVGRSERRRRVHAPHHDDRSSVSTKEIRGVFSVCFLCVNPDGLTRFYVYDVERHVASDNINNAKGGVSSVTHYIIVNSFEKFQF